MAQAADEPRHVAHAGEVARRVAPRLKAEVEVNRVCLRAERVLADASRPPSRLRRVPSMKLTASLAIIRQSSIAQASNSWCLPGSGP